MSPIRVRVFRDTPETGQLDWAAGGGAARRWRPGDAPLSGECHLVVPSGQVAILAAELPAAQADRVGASLRFLVEDRMVSDPERTHVASARIAKDRLCLALVDRAWLQAVLARVRKAGLLPRAAFPECLLPPCPEGDWTVVCAAGESFARTGPWAGFALGPLDLQAPPDALRVALQEGRPKTIVLRPTPEGTLPDAAAWSAALGVRVGPGPPWHWTREGSSGLDLLQGEFAARAARGAGLARLRRVAVLAALVVAVFSAGLSLEWLAKSRERSQLLAEMTRLHREAFGERVPVVDPPAQMRQALAELRSRSGKASPGDFLALLTAAFDGPLERGSARIHELTYDGGTLAILLSAVDAKRISAAAGRSDLDVLAEPAQWNGQPATRMRLRPRESGWTAKR